MSTIKIFKCHPDAIIPQRQSTEAVGLDLHAVEDFILYPGRRSVVGTGLVVQPPEGYHTEILLRSGMAYKHNVMLLNGVGLIDRDYAGPADELKIMLYCAPVMHASLGIDLKSAHAVYNNYSPIAFKKGDRIAQLVIRKTYLPEVEEVEFAPGDDRGGLGSTGK